MHPAYVSPCAKRGRTGAGDAEAIRESVSTPTIRFAPIKSHER
jgi:transposase